TSGSGIVGHPRLRVRDRATVKSPGKSGAFSRRRMGATTTPQCTHPNPAPKVLTQGLCVTNSTTLATRGHGQTVPSNSIGQGAPAPSGGRCNELTVRIANMTDLEWARAFVGCKIKGTGIRFGKTVDVLVKKLTQVREEA